ncbi:MAG: 30S ribosomal protein S20 [Gemmatimonadetes bacterium]|nr:MAG: 30S ribosomal protein S20 [Gemmatimonadota bacterium]
MPHHKSAIKRVRQSKKRRERNRMERSAVRTAIKAVRKATTKEDALNALPRAYSVLDKAVKRNLIHANTAARHKSRLTRYVEKLG